MTNDLDLFKPDHVIWIVALIFGTIAAFALGPFGFIVGFLLTVIIWKIFFRNAPPKETLLPPPKRQESEAISRKPFIVNPQTVTRIELPVSPHTTRQSKKPNLQWHPTGSLVEVGGVKITTGQIYICDAPLFYPGEPSAIDRSLRVASTADDPIDELGYFSSYDGFTPGQRRAYLDWLANGRIDKDPASRSLGYLFSFFYGLEKRILIEKDRDPTLVQEIIRLLNVYGSAHKSRSLRRYFLQLAHFASWQWSNDEYRAIWPSLIDFEGERPNEESLRFALANLYQRNEPLDWTMAYRLALVSEECRKSVVLTKSREQFWPLFQTRFYEMFPSGLTLKASKSLYVSSYISASAALRYAKNSDLTLRIPNVLALHSQFSFLPKLWNSCIEDLSGFSRVISSKRSGSGLKAWQALPVELRKPENHPMLADWNALLESAPREGNYVIVRTAYLASMLGIAERAKLSGSQSQDITALVSAFECCLAPDVRFSGVPLLWNQETLLFVCPEKPTEQLAGLVNLLYLAICLAAADGIIEPEELARFNSLVASEVNSPATWIHLIATEEALRRDGSIATQALSHVAKRIPVERRESVLKAMVHVASADGNVGPDEAKALKKIARAFVLEDGVVESLMGGFGEVTVTGKSGEKENGEKIPQKMPAKSFQLDEARIKALTAETHEVIAMLAEVMVEPEDKTPPHENLPQKEATNGVPDWAQNLETRYQPAFMELITYDNLTNDALELLSSKYHLMSDDLVNGINTWSDEFLGDFLLERTEDTRVFRELLPDS